MPLPSSFRRRSAPPSPDSGLLDTNGSPRPIAEHPKFVAMREPSAALARAHRVATLQTRLLEHEVYFRRNGKTPPAHVREGIAAARRELAALAPEPSGPEAGVPEEVAAAFALIAGEKVEPASTPETKLQNARRAVEILDKATFTQDGLFYEMKAELSAEVAQALAPRHQEILRTMLEAARALSAVVMAERQLIAEMIVAGFDLRADILRRPTIVLPAAYEIGTESDTNSQLHRFREVLENWGII